MRKVKYMLQTERLIIRQFLPRDGADLFEYLSDPNVVRYEPYDVLTLEECCLEAEQRTGDEAFWAVCLHDGQKLIGNLYFEKQRFDTWELGYVFNASYQGKGYALESAQALMRYAFTMLGARRIVANCNPDNEKSWRLLERLGFRREGHRIRGVYFKRDENGCPLWHDTYEYAILAEEWHCS
jgi:RimJ/RimL family protein N-acetyltransferase